MTKGRRRKGPRTPRNEAEATWARQVREQVRAEEIAQRGPPRLGLPEPDDLARYESKVGFPGRPPFTRGIQPTMYRGRLWAMQQYAASGTASETNRQLRELVAHGRTGLAVAFDLPTQVGLDPDHPRAKGEVGRRGVSIATTKDMDELLRGIPLDTATVSMTVNATAPILVGLLVNVAEASGVPRAKLGGTVQNDILMEYAAGGNYLYPPEPSLRLAVDLIEYGTRHLLRWNPLCVSGYPMREAGATAAQEVAFTLADGLAYARAVAARGLDVDEVLARMSFFFSADRRFLEEIAKYRAARRLWGELTKDVLHARSARARELRFHTRTAGSSLTAQQPELNVVRTTLEALSAVLGGTQSLHTNALDEALGAPTAASARLALRTQQLLAEESGVANTVDPLAGAWAIEELTDEVEEDARAYLDEVERMGGATGAAARGYYRQEIAREAQRRARALEQGEERVVGVNRHTEGDPRFSLFPEERRKTGSSRGPRISPEIERRAVAAVRTWRKRRRAAATETALGELRRASVAGENVMPSLIEALGQKATLGEVAQLWREVFGEPTPPRGHP